MEENLPNDRLEDFIRESFKDHDTDPGGHVWDRIDQSLGHTPVAPTGVRLKYWSLSIAASISVIAIAFLIFNNLHLNKQLKQIKEETARLELKSQMADSLLSANPPKTNQILSDGPVNEFNKNENGEFSLITESSTNEPELSTDITLEKTGLDPFIAQHPAERESTIADQNKEGILKLKSRDERKKISSNDLTKLNQKSKPRSENIFIPEDLILESNKLNYSPKSKSNPKIIYNRPNANTQNQELAKNKGPLKNNYLAENAQSSPEPKNQILNNADSKVEENILIPNTVLRELTAVRPLAAKYPKPVSSMTNQATLDYVNTNSLTSPLMSTMPRSMVLNVSGGSFAESGSLTPPSPLPGHGISPPNNSYHTTQSWQAGIGISKYLTKNFQWQAGITIKQYQVSNQMNQNFLFGERLRNPGKPAFEHDFGYKIHSPGGSANIEISSEQLDPRATIEDTEKISFKINNSTEFKYLTFPIAINYTKSFGRLGWFIGTGLQTNFLLKQEAETKIEVISSKLKLKKEIESPKFERSKALVFNGILSAGLQYRLTHHISVQLSPSLYIPFSKRNKDREAQYHMRSYGFQLGINYDLASL